MLSLGEYKLVDKINVSIIYLFNIQYINKVSSILCRWYAGKSWTENWL